KFTGFATVTNAPGPYRLAPGAPDGGTPLKLIQSAQSVEIDTGKFIARIPRSGASLVDTITIGDQIVARDARLLCTLDDDSEFLSEIKKVTVEQTGPVRAVVKLEGVHKSPAREWLPFIVRLYFYAGADPIRMLHTIVFDGDHERDFIKGLGVVFTVPMREQL